MQSKKFVGTNGRLRRSILKHSMPAPSMVVESTTNELLSSGIESLSKLDMLRVPGISSVRGLAMDDDKKIE